MASKITQLINLIRGAAYIENPLQDYHAAKAARDAFRCSNSYAITMAVQRALKQYRVMVSHMPDGKTRIYRPDTGQEYVA